TEIVGRTYNTDTDTYLPLYSDETNNERLPDFHQLDVRIDKAWAFNRWTLAAYLDVQNAYFYRYPFGYWYNHDYTEREKVVFPTFFPSLGLQARF
ncbi:MAG TPA: energy transducer TonB, partial [bacterium]|nr:energy transducer TonB [bacterium]